MIGLRRELGELFWPLFDLSSEQLELKSAGSCLECFCEGDLEDFTICHWNGWYSVLVRLFLSF